MKNDPLVHLLRAADAGQSPPVGPPDLAKRVRRRVRRGRIAARVLTAGLVIVVGVASFWYRSLPAEDAKPLAKSSARERAISPADVAHLRREFARLNADAELHERTAQLILARQRSATRSVEGVDANEALTTQLERSALTLVNRGENLLHDPSTRAQAVESYRRAVQLFPQSRGAALARERLNQMGA